MACPYIYLRDMQLTDKDTPRRRSRTNSSCAFGYCAQDTGREKEAANSCSPFLRPEVKVTANGDDAASHGGGRGTNRGDGPYANRSDGRDRRDGPTHARAHAH